MLRGDNQELTKKDTWLLMSISDTDNNKNISYDEVSRAAVIERAFHTHFSARAHDHTRLTVGSYQIAHRSVQENDAHGHRRPHLDGRVRSVRLEGDEDVRGATAGRTVG